MKHDAILLDHGAGGKLSHGLISERLVPVFDDPALSCLDDGAVIDAGPVRLAFSTDSYVVDPIFFPGGDIGSLAVNGTVNDLAMCGARPLCLSTALIIEEGFPLSDLDRILHSMKKAACYANVRLVTGDTKVVPRGAADKIFINTSGIGLIDPGVEIGGRRAVVGDRIILSGPMADHGMTILTQREGLRFDSPVQSDCAPLNHMVAAVLSRFPQAVHVLRDPTRGGVGTTLNEIARASGVGIEIHEDRLPVRPEVAGICELLGFDPLYVANEGKLIAFVEAGRAEDVLSEIRNNEFGTGACIIGEAVAGPPGRVYMKTRIGGSRIVDMLAGDQLPRIC